MRRFARRAKLSFRTNKAYVERIGRYRIVERLGQGGMGVVYKAFDPQIERTVAIKVISGHRFDNPELRERFFREARAAGGLTHPNIVIVYDLGEELGQPYLAMEFVDGTTLDALMHGAEPFPMGRRLAIMLDVCEGLAYAHGRGIIHRDVKPGNIMVTRAGSAKILDFGLARLISSDLTRSNMMLGTMNYMAPEQLRGQAIDQRVDIFAVGVVMYELFGGRKPFEGDSLASAIYKVLEEDPPPVHECNPSAPQELGFIVARALAKDRDHRYTRMEDLERDLLDVQAELGDQLAEAAAPGYVPDPAAAEFEPTMLRETPAPVVRRTTPTPRPAATPTRRTPTPSGVPAARPPSGPVDTSKGAWMRLAGIAAAVLIVVLAVAVLVWRGRDVREPGLQAPAAETGSPATGRQDVGRHVTRGRQALETDDYSTAIREARAALKLSPGAPEAQKLLADAEGLQSKVETGTREAQRLYDAGQLKEAEHAATTVLGLAPNNPHARDLIAKLSQNARRETADEAMQHVERARRQAEAQGARDLARTDFQRAERVERDGRRRYAAGEYAEATSRLYESSGLFSTAGSEARRQAALRQKQRAEAETKRVAEELKGRIEEARQEYERRRRAAVLAGAESRAPERFNAALHQAAAAEGRGDAGAVDEYVRAAAGMAEARTLAIKAAEHERASREQQAPPAPVATRPPAPAAPQAVPEPPPEAGVRAALAQYAAALEARDLGAMKRIWPSLSGDLEQGIRDDFQNAREIDVEIANERIDVTGDSATVTCLRRYRIQTRDGHRLATENRTIITLHKTGRSWSIQSMRFEEP